MRVLLLAGIFTAVLAPGAFAIEDTKACDLDDTRRAAEDSTPPSPAPAAVRRAEATPPAVTAEPTRTIPARRRGGKRIPDSELIGPRGAL